MAKTACSSRRKQPDCAAGNSSGECAGQAHSKILETKLLSTEAQPGPVPEQGCTGLKAIHAQVHP
eukprot:6179110-Pleurochrysis_carterae.AAC.1